MTGNVKSYWQICILWEKTTWKKSIDHASERDFKTHRIFMKTYKNWMIKILLDSIEIPSFKWVGATSQLRLGSPASDGWSHTLSHSNPWLTASQSIPPWVSVRGWKWEEDSSLASILPCSMLIRIHDGGSRFANCFWFNWVVFLTTDGNGGTVAFASFQAQDTMEQDESISVPDLGTAGASEGWVSGILQFI